MNIYDIVEELLEQTENLNKRLSELEIKFAQDKEVAQK
jgi:hypothetical protein